MTISSVTFFGGGGGGGGGLFPSRQRAKLQRYGRGSSSKRKSPLTDARKGHRFGVESYAYNGGGHEVQRAKCSLTVVEIICALPRKPQYPTVTNTGVG